MGPGGARCAGVRSWPSSIREKLHPTPGWPAPGVGPTGIPGWRTPIAGGYTSRKAAPRQAPWCSRGDLLDQGGTRAPELIPLEHFRYWDLRIAAYPQQSGGPVLSFLDSRSSPAAALGKASLPGDLQPPGEVALPSLPPGAGEELSEPSRAGRLDRRSNCRKGGSTASVPSSSTRKGESCAATGLAFLWSPSLPKSSSFSSSDRAE